MWHEHVRVFDSNLGERPFRRHKLQKEYGFKGAVCSQSTDTLKTRKAFSIKRCERRNHRTGTCIHIATLEEVGCVSVQDDHQKNKSTPHGWRNVNQWRQTNCPTKPEPDARSAMMLHAKTRSRPETERHVFVVTNTCPSMRCKKQESGGVREASESVHDPFSWPIIPSPSVHDRVQHHISTHDPLKHRLKSSGVAHVSHGSDAFTWANVEGRNWHGKQTYSTPTSEKFLMELFCQCALFRHCIHCVQCPSDCRGSACG